MALSNVCKGTPNMNGYQELPICPHQLVHLEGLKVKIDEQRDRRRK